MKMVSSQSIPLTLLERGDDLLLEIVHGTLPNIKPLHGEEMQTSGSKMQKLRV
jgi:hypothetical protein